jgi:hypothetical protein
MALQGTVLIKVDGIRVFCRDQLRDPWWPRQQIRKVELQNYTAARKQYGKLIAWGEGRRLGTAGIPRSVSLQEIADVLNVLDIDVLPVGWERMHQMEPEAVNGENHTSSAHVRTLFANWLTWRSESR